MEGQENGRKGQGTGRKTDRPGEAVRMRFRVVRNRRGRWGDSDLSRGEIFDLLSNERRRGVVHYLKLQEREVQLDELVEAVVEWEGGDSSRASVYAGLVQTHLPRMADAGILEYDDVENTVRPTDELQAVQIYLEAPPRVAVPWAEYYLALAVGTVALVWVVWLGIPPFGRLSGLTVAFVIAIVMLASAAFHAIQTHRSLLGSAPKRARDEA